MENKKQIIRAMNNLTYSVIKKIKNEERNLVEKVLTNLLDEKPTKKAWKKITKVIQQDGNDYTLRYDKSDLGVVKFEMVDNNLSIRFIPNEIK